MTSTDESPRAGSDPHGAHMSLGPSAPPQFRVQPVPSAAARIVSTGRRGDARDRLRLLSMYGSQHRRAMADVAQTLPEAPTLRDGLRDSRRVGAFVDLAAVRLYLDAEWEWLDPAISEAAVGEHLVLARCVASGLRKLPVYRGPAIVRTSAIGPVAEWYREHTYVIEQGFWSASVSSAALSKGGLNFLVWSLTGRRTGLLGPSAPDRVVFAPGSRFRVLRVSEGRHPLVLMRELFPPEPAEERHNASTAWLDESTLSELEGALAKLPASLTTDTGGPRARLPGLIVTADAMGTVGH